MTNIGKGIQISGTIHANEPVVVSGQVVGDILAENHDVTLAEGARVEGSISARTIAVRGRSRGRLIARDIVRLLQTAIVDARIASPRLVLEEGALFNGSVAPAKTDAAIRVAAYRGKGEPAARAAG